MDDHRPSVLWSVVVVGEVHASYLSQPLAREGMDRDHCVPHVLCPEIRLPKLLANQAIPHIQGC